MLLPRNLADAIGHDVAPAGAQGQARATDAIEALTGAVAMTDTTDAVELARELADLARRTADAETGRLLMILVAWLLGAAGLPPCSA